METNSTHVGIHLLSLEVHKAKVTKCEIVRPSFSLFCFPGVRCILTVELLLVGLQTALAPFGFE